MEDQEENNSATPLEGKTTVDDGMFFEPCRLSYHSSDYIADQIVKQIQKESEGRTVVIATISLLADLANLQALYVELEDLCREYEAIATKAKEVTKPAVVARGAEEVVKKGLAAAISPATAFVSAALGLVSLFRQDVEYHGLKTDIDTIAFELNLASKLKAKGAKEAFVPDFMVVPSADETEGMLRSRLINVQKAKSDAWAAVAPLIGDLVQLESELDHAAKDDQKTAIELVRKKVALKRRDVQPFMKPLELADERFVEIHKRWTQVGKDTQITWLGRVLRVEAIQKKTPLYVHAQVVASGGHHRVVRNLFRMMFSGDGLSFMGGAIVRWALLDDSGAVLKGGILTGRLQSSFD